MLIKFIALFLWLMVLAFPSQAAMEISFETFIEMAGRNIFIRTSQNQEEHEESSILNPCGGKGQERMTASITQYFMYRWKAKYQDLTDKDVRRYREYFELSEEIVAVRIFSSSQQPTLAALTSRRFEDYLDEEKTKPLVSVLCIVPVSANKLVRQLTPRELEHILEDNSSDI